MSAMGDLLAHAAQTAALEQVAGRLHWDQETKMPKGAAAQRAEEIAAMEGVLHARRTDPALGELLEIAQAETDFEASSLRLISRSHQRATKIPARLAAELARTASLAHGVWAKARAEDDVAGFLPVLEQLITLRREEAACLSGETRGAALYDAMLNDYEPEMRASEIAALFDAMRPRLVALRAAILEKPMPAAISGDFDEAAQLALTREIALAFGYDLDKGRIDLAVHPFSSGSGSDSRITTRVARDDPFNALYSTIHEVGHACYEQNIDPLYHLTALGQGASMGVHESQSRIYENQLGRSLPFVTWLYGQMQTAFGGLSTDSPAALYAAINRVAKGYIRTEADEVQYNLHIMLRFDLEQALISGDLAVADLEAAWNDRFMADFGFAVDRPSHGVLQDVHWSAGLFGYFPTYALGNVYAGCLMQALRADVPNLDAALAQGNPRPATDWLRERLQRHGSLKPPCQTIEDAIGGPVSPEPLLRYLEEKFGALYGL